MPKLHVLDFETASYLDLKVVGAWRYSEDISTEVLCLSFETGNDILTWTPGGEGWPDVLLRRMAVDPDAIFGSFGAFEKSIWRNIMVEVHGFPDVPDSRWHDIQAIAAMKAMPQDLDTLTIALDLPRKDMEGSNLVKSLSKYTKKDNKKTGVLKGTREVVRTPEVMQRAYEYCEDDVKEERLVLDALGNFQPGERKVWLLDQKINQRGIRLDLDYIAACRKIVNEATVPLAREFAAITGGLSFTQGAKTKAWLDKEGVRLPDLTKETIARALGKDIDSDDPLETDDFGDSPDLPQHVRRALEIRQLVGSAAIKKLPRMQSCVASDGRAHYLLQYCGTNSGRWAGRLFQPHNFPRPTFKDGDGELLLPELIVDALMTGDWEYVQAVVGPPVEIVVNGLRHAMIAGKGKKFVSGDYSQVELRGLMAHAGQMDKVQMLIDGLSPYLDLAGQIYKRPIDKKRDVVEYDIGKHAVLGLGYQMGGGTQDNPGGTFYRRYGRDHATPELCYEAVQTYRKEWAPRVPEHWEGLEEAACETAWDKTPHEFHGVEFRIEDRWLTARLLSGRKIYFPDPEPRHKHMPWSTKDKPDIRRSWSFTVIKNGVLGRKDAFGGMLTGVITQGIARDLMVHGMFGLEANGFPIILTVHDEIVAEPDAVNADELAFKQIMCDRPAWAAAMNFPVKVETWVGDRYRK